MPPALTYALLALCAALFVFGFVLEGRKEGRLARARRFAWVVQIGAIALAYLVLRPGSGTSDPQSAVVAARAAHAPIFLDFYSNY